MELNKSKKLDPFYLHTFSNNYDILIGRYYLKESKEKINYEEEIVMLGDTLIYIKYGENDIGKDKSAVKCLSPPSFEK